MTEKQKKKAKAESFPTLSGGPVQYKHPQPEEPKKVEILQRPKVQEEEKVEVPFEDTENAAKNGGKKGGRKRKGGGGGAVELRGMFH